MLYDGSGIGCRLSSYVVSLSAVGKARQAPRSYSEEAPEALCFELKYKLLIINAMPPPFSTPIQKSGRGMVIK